MYDEARQRNGEESKRNLNNGDNSNPNNMNVDQSEKIIKSA